MLDAISQFRDAIRSAGLEPPEAIKTDGILRRFASNGRCGDDAGWYVLYGDGIPAGAFGDWRTGIIQTWRADIGRTLTPAEEAAHKAKVDAISREREVEETKRRAEAATSAAAIWDVAKPAADDHPYLTRKGIKSNGARLNNGDLVIPVCEGEAINSLQFISPNGDKLFLTGGRVKGCYFSIGSTAGATALCIAEGFATGATIHEATGYPVAAAFNAGNLQAVAQTMREKFPDLKLILCADDDTATSGNPGLTKATEAARAVGGLLAIPDFGDDRPEGVSDFNDLYQHCGIDAVRAAIANASEPPIRGHQPIAKNAPVEAIEWLLPILFDEIETPDIPASLLPDVFGDFASALAEETETPEALAVMTVLSILSTCMAKRFVVSPRQGWREPVNIYTITGLPPANNKSLALKRCRKPLEEWESYQEEILGPDIFREQSERKTQEKIIEKLRTKAAGANGSDQAGLIKEIADKEAALIEPRFLPQLFLTDATPEALGLSVHEQNGRFAIITDEGGILEVVAGLYSNGAANVDLILKGIDGGATRIRRMGRYVGINPYLTLAVVAQPAIIQGMGGKRAFAGNGMTERFLYALPKSKLGYRTHTTRSAEQRITDAYHQRIIDLLNIPAVIKDDVEHPRILTLEPTASSDWREFQRLVEMDLRPGGRMAPCLGWGGKISGYALRIAGLIHVAEHGHHNLVISQETMKRALEISTLLIDHALAAFGLMGVDQATSDAKELYQWVISQGKAGFTQRDITFAMRNRKMGKIDRLYPAIEILLERHILTMERLPTKKPTTNYHVNPALIKE